jgi:hypothetical protein
MAVLCPFRTPSLWRDVHREFMRNALLDLNPILPTTACHQRNYVETYSNVSSGEAWTWKKPEAPVCWAEATTPPPGLPGRLSGPPADALRRS